MRLHRFYISNKIIMGEKIILTDSDLIHQMVNVFRFQNRDKVILFDGSGFEYETEIVSITKKEIVLIILTQVFCEVLPIKVCLYLALIKKDNFELAAEKCTEIGVSEIQPIISERSEKKDLNIERINKIVKEASEQSGRVFLPKVLEIKSLEIAVSQAVIEERFCIAFHTDTDSSTAPSPSLSNEGESPKEIAVFVGPEGGWSEKEVALFKKNNFQICSLGQNILRAETAAMIAVWNFLNFKTVEKPLE
jgi:16S rRNA (uracil1498-N3)-methyltransferase